MATPVQITVTVDPSGAVTGFSQIGNAATTMGQTTVTAGLTGADAVAALTKQWNAEQAAIAAVNARIKENMAAQAESTATVQKASTAFQGMTSEQMKASVTGRLLESTLGLQNRALNQVISRSAILGPLMAGLFNVGIFAAVVPMIVRIGEGIANGAQAAGGMTEEVKKMNAELAQANQQAFLHPQNSDQAMKNLTDINNQVAANEKQVNMTFSQRVGLIEDGTNALGKMLGIDTLLIGYELTHNTAIQKGMELTKQQSELQKQYTEDVVKAGVAQADIAAKQSGLHGFALLDSQEATAIAALTKARTLQTITAEQEAQLELDIRTEFSQKRIQLEQSESDKVLALRHQVTDETLTGVNKIYSDEAFAIDQATKLQQRGGTSYQDLQQTKVLLHQKALNEIAAYDRAADQHIKELQQQAVASALTGDDAIRQSGEKLKEAEGLRLAQGLEDDTQYNAAIRLINEDTNNKIQAADQKTTDKRAEQLVRTQAMEERAAEDMKTAQEDAALAAVPEWQRATAQIQIELNRRERAIEDQKIKELAAEHLTQDQITAINLDADAKRYDAIVQADSRIREENLRLTQQLGSDLQSVFDDITSGNIGKRILANIEKLFFQIVAQWVLSLGIMKSAAGSVFGSIVFGPQSTGANVFGGGQGGGPLSLLGSLFGSSSATAPSGAAFQPGGIFSNPSLFAGGTPAGGAASFSSSGSASAVGSLFSSSSSAGVSSLGSSVSSGLGGAIAGTSAMPGGGLVSSASSALTSSTMADALSAGTGIGGGIASTAASKAGGVSSLFSAQGLTSLAGLGLGTVGGAFGGKTGQAGGLLMGLLLSGHLAPVLSSLYGTLGLAGTGALVGGATGGLVGFGVGQSQGGLFGSLAGAGSGALMGFLAGGPIGAVVGGIIGLLGGIFGGIFGGSKRKKQANALADNTILPDITQIVTGFDGFGADSSSAIQQLEQLRTDSQKQLDALKSQGKDVYNQKVGPAIDSAEKHIRDTQSERDRRSAQVFGPPQFDTGGMFSVMRGGNAGLAVLHDGEMVINPQATKKNAAALNAMNQGKTVGGHIEVHIHPDSFDRAYVKSRHFEDDITNALTRASAEGRWF